MKRKFLIILLSLVCALCMAFGLACGGSDDSGTDSGGTGGNVDGGTGGDEPPEDPLDDETPDEPSAGDDGGEELYYTLSDDGAGYVVSGIGSVTSTDIVIPAEYNGKPVTGIGYEAFYKNGDITSVVIGENVEVIGEYAFSQCTAITEIEIPAGVTEICYGAFLNCDALKSITVASGNAVYKSVDGDLYSLDGTVLIQYAIGKLEISFAVPDGVTEIYDSAFESSMLAEVTFGSGSKLKTIGDYAFYGNWNLTDIDIPDSVTGIGYYAFGYCGGLPSVDLPKKLTTLGNYAFACCYLLESVTIYAGVTDIGEYAFGCCYALTEFTVASGNAAFKAVDGDLYTYDGTELIQYAVGKTAKTFTVPEGVEKIGGSAFDGCTRLTGVVLSDGVKEIGNYAFYGCTALASITLPASVKYIGFKAFYGCTSLESVTFENAEGWFASETSEAEGGEAVDVSDGINNAALLTETYVTYYWYRTEN